MRKNMEIYRILDYVEKHLSEDLSLEKISREFHYSKYYIERVFAHTYGKSFYQYVKARRLTVAAQELVETQKPIIEVAYDAHYSSQQAFTLAFHQEYLCTPQEYRKKGFFSPKQPKLVKNDIINKACFEILSNRIIEVTICDDAQTHNLSAA